MTARGLSWGAVLVLACAAPQRPAETSTRLPQPRAIRVVKLHDVVGAPEVRFQAWGQPEIRPTGVVGVAHIRVALDESSAAECAVRSDRLDLAQALRQALADIDRRVPLASRRITNMLHWEPGGWAALGMRLAYTNPMGQEGVLRMVATNVEDQGVFCSLDAREHDEDFATLVEGLVVSLAQHVELPAQRRRVYWVELSGGWQGILEDVGRTRVEDQLHMDTAYASLVVADGQGLRAADEVNVEVTDEGGEFRFLRSIRQEDGVVQRDVHVLPNARHRLVARHGDKEPVLDLGPALPVTGRGIREHLRQALARDGVPAQQVFLRYFPGLSATSLAEEQVVLLRKDGGGGWFRSRIQTPGSQAAADYEVAADGEMARSNIQWPGGWARICRVGNYCTAR